MTKKILIVVSLLFFLSVAGLLLLQHYVVKQAISAYHAESITSAQFERFITDIKKVDELGIFKPTTQQKNAGELLNPYIPLDDKPNSVQKTIWWNDPRLTTTFRRAKNKWYETPEEVADGDLSILSQLMEYDHWDMTTSGTYGEYLQTGVNAYDYMSSIPNFITISTLAKLRLAQGLRTGQPLPALQEVRHLAKLTYSTHHSLVSTMVAVGLLKIEKQGYEAAVKKQLISPDEWKSVTDEDIDSMRRVSFTMILPFIDQGVPDAYKKIRRLDIPLFGECTALTEATSFVMNLHLINANFPFESDFLELAKPLSQALEQTSCPTKRIRASLREHQYIPPRKKLKSNALDVVMLEIPYIRVLTFAPMFRVAMPSWNKYGKTPEEDYRSQKDKPRKRSKKGEKKKQAK